MSETNWAGNYTYQAKRVHRPTTLDEVRRIVAVTRQLRVLGSRHSFNDVADATELVSLRGLPADIVVDHTAGTVSLGPGVTYGELASALRSERVALANMASLPHICVAGAIATATHGSGDANGNLATAVGALEFVMSGGDVVITSRGDEDFDGLVVGLGAVGAVTRVTLDVEPSYEVRQRVFEGLAWDALYDHFDEVSASGYSVSVFTRWGQTIDQLWVKTRVTDEPERVVPQLLGAGAATVNRHPILGLDAVNCTPQLGHAGLWSERLPHFRMGFTPSSGAELQSEFLLPRRYAIPAIKAVRALADSIRPLLQVSEIRTIAADGLWMSPQYGRDTVAIHFTWNPQPGPVTNVLADVEAALAPFDARPHWGKLFLADASKIAGLYDRHADFVALVDRLDPRGAFRNAWFEARVLGR